MDSVELTGRITQEGKLEVTPPEGLPPGEVRVRIEHTGAELLTDPDAAHLVQTDPASGAEIVAAGLTGSWHDLGLEDGQAWVEDRRRKRKEQRGW